MHTETTIAITTIYNDYNFSSYELKTGYRNGCLR